MAVYCVTYDLNSPGQKYNAVSEYLKKFAYCKHLDSFWLIDTIKTAETIRKELVNIVDNNDVVFVSRLQGEWSSWNYQCADWLNDSQRSW